MSLYNINNQSINPEKISRISKILISKTDGRNYFYFNIYLAGNIFSSKKYEERTEAINERNLLITEVD
jgi:hypothetical protein